MAGHARNAPSDAKRWIMCPGALKRCRDLGIVDKGSSAAADEGTAAHWIREQCLEFGFDAFDFLGAKVLVNGVSYECDMGMVGALQPGLDRIGEFEGELFIERRLNITKWTGKTEDGEDQFGTLDCGVVPHGWQGDEVVVSDLKYGRGVPVDAVENPQQVIYSASLWELIKHDFPHIKRFRIIIDQPRNSAGGGEWVITVDELLEKAQAIREAADKTFDPNAPCTPSVEGCMWCPASKVIGNCPEHDAFALELGDVREADLDDYDDWDEPLPLPDVASLTPARIRVIYENRAILKKFVERVEAHVADAVRHGEGELYGLKMVAGKRSNRVHVDEDQSAAWLELKGYKDDQIFTKKLITPAQLDKLLGRGKFPRDLVAGGEPKPVIAPIDDARPALPVATFVDESVDEMDELD